MKQLQYQLVSTRSIFLMPARGHTSKHLDACKLQNQPERTNKHEQTNKPASKKSNEQKNKSNKQNMNTRTQAKNKLKDEQSNE